MPMHKTDTWATLVKHNRENKKVDSQPAEVPKKPAWRKVLAVVTVLGLVGGGAIGAYFGVTAGLPASPVNGGWSSWSPASNCSTTCGYGTRNYTRTCASPAPKYGGSNCTGAWDQVLNCTDSSGCSGVVSQDVIICEGSPSQSVTCNNSQAIHIVYANYGRTLTSNQVCPYNQTQKDDTNCYSANSTSSVIDWCEGEGNCTLQYGNKLFGGDPCASTYKYLEVQYQCISTVCFPLPINGMWSAWSPSTNCSNTCGNGTMGYSRNCNSPAPQYGGSCTGSSTKTMNCTDTSECPPVDGMWSAWSPVYSCSVPCGFGAWNYNRSCDSPPPMYGGDNCTGPTEKVADCSDSPTPIDSLIGASGSPVIPDSSLTASSSYASLPGPEYHAPNRSRLNSQSIYLCCWGGAWSAAAAVVAGDWIQADLGVSAQVYSVQTQGRQNITQWVTQYYVMYGYSTSTLAEYQENQVTKVFSGNSDSNTIVTNCFNPVISARYVRLYVLKFVNHPSLRWDLLGYTAPLQNLIGPSGYPVIPDSALTASTVFGGDADASSDYYAPNRSRLYTKFIKTIYGGAWSPVAKQAGDWIQADLGGAVEVYSIRTQGRNALPQWVTQYYVMYGYFTTALVEYQENGDRKVFTGNSDQDTEVTNNFITALTGRYVRLYIVEYYSFPSLRWELLGYQVPGPKIYFVEITGSATPGNISRLSLSSGVQSVLSVSGGADERGIAVDNTTNTVYFSMNTNASVWKANFSDFSGTRTKIWSSTAFVPSLALSIVDKLIFVDQNPGGIAMMDYDVNNVYILNVTSKGACRGIVVDPSFRIVYFTDDSNARIWKSTYSLSGWVGSPLLLLNGTGTGQVGANPEGLVMEGGTLFWILNTAEIRSMSTTGSTSVTVVNGTGSTAVNSMGLAKLGLMFYYTSYASNGGVWQVIAGGTGARLTPNATLYTWGLMLV